MSNALPPINNTQPAQSSFQTFIERNPEIAIGALAIMAFVLYGRIKNRGLSASVSVSSDAQKERDKEVFIPATQTFITANDLPSMPNVNSTIAMSVSNPVSMDHDYTYTARVMTTSQDRRNYTVEVMVPFPQNILGAESDIGTVQVSGGKVVWQAYALDSSPSTLSVHVRLQSPTPIVSAIGTMHDNQSGQSSSDTVSASVTGSTTPAPSVIPAPVIPTPLPTTPSGLTVSAANGAFALAWNPATGASLQSVRYRPSGGTWVDNPNFAPTASSYFLVNRPKGEKLDFQIRGIVLTPGKPGTQPGDYFSTWSNLVTATMV